MKSYTVVVATMWTFVTLGTAAATAPDNRQAAEELMRLTNAEKSVSAVRDQLQAMIAAQIQALDIPANMKDSSVLYEQKVVDLIFSELSPTKLKPAYVDVYANTFSAQELAGIIAFYKTAAGQSYAQKLPTVTSKMMEISQERVKSLEPQLQKMQEEFMSELEKASGKH